jgi:hypothetical protein
MSTEMSPDAGAGAQEELRLGPTHPTRADAERARLAVRGLLVGEESLNVELVELADIAGLLAHESVLRAASGAELHCRILRGSLELETVDGLPHAPLDSRLHYLALAAPTGTSWGVDFGNGRRRAWFRLPLGGPVGSGPPGLPSAREVAGADTEHSAGAAAAAADERGWLALLAEAGQLLGGLLDGRQIATITAQLVVPRLADWAAVHLADPQTGTLATAFAWHSDEQRSPALHSLLDAADGPVALGGVARDVPLEHNGRRLGLLQVGRTQPFPPELIDLLDELAHRVAPALSAAEAHGRQVETTRALQRGLLPRRLPAVAGTETAVVYEPAELDTLVGGDFYDLFALPGGARWAFALGDVCGHGPRAAAVTGLARHSLRLFARLEGGGSPAEVVDRLNHALMEEEAEEEAESAAGEEAGIRMLALLKGELTPHQDGSVDCRLVCAGQPLPLLLRRDGGVVPAAGPQPALGLLADPEYRTEQIRLLPGETLLCVTDGVTERRRGRTLLDDGDGLAELFSGCAGLGAGAIAGRLRRAVLGYSPTTPTDDIAMLILRVRDTR